VGADRKPIVCSACDQLRQNASESKKLRRDGWRYEIQTLTDIASVPLKVNDHAMIVEFQ